MIVSVSPGPTVKLAVAASLSSRPSARWRQFI
jgi:hypothetical protein